MRVDESSPFLVDRIHSAITIVPMISCLNFHYPPTMLTRLNLLYCDFILLATRCILRATFPSSIFGRPAFLQALVPRVRQCRLHHFARSPRAVHRVGRRVREPDRDRRERQRVLPPARPADGQGSGRQRFLL